MQLVLAEHSGHGRVESTLMSLRKAPSQSCTGHCRSCRHLLFRTDYLNLHRGFRQPSNAWGNVPATKGSFSSCASRWEVSLSNPNGYACNTPGKPLNSEIYLCALPSCLIRCKHDKTQSSAKSPFPKSHYVWVFPVLSRERARIQRVEGSGGP